MPSSLRGEWEECPGETGLLHPACACRALRLPAPCRSGAQVPRYSERWARRPADSPGQPEAPTTSAQPSPPASPSRIARFSSETGEQVHQAHPQGQLLPRAEGAGGAVPALLVALWWSKGCWVLVRRPSATRTGRPDGWARVQARTGLVGCCGVDRGCLRASICRRRASCTEGYTCLRGKVAGAAMPTGPLLHRTLSPAPLRRPSAARLATGSHPLTARLSTPPSSQQHSQPASHGRSPVLFSAAAARSI